MMIHLILLYLRQGGVLGDPPRPPRVGYDSAGVLPRPGEGPVLEPFRGGVLKPLFGRPGGSLGVPGRFGGQPAGWGAA